MCYNNCTGIMPKDGKRRAVLEDAGMYRMNRQMRIEDFAFPYGQLDKNNEWTVRHVSENPYLQYCLGLKEYTSQCPFGASTTVELRKRFPFLLCWQLPPLADVISLVIAIPIVIQMKQKIRYAEIGQAVTSE